MVLASVNDLAASEVTLTLPRLGRAVAEVRLNAGPGALTVDQAVTLAIAGSSWTMAVTRSGDDRGRLRVLLVAGAGKLHQPVKAKYYEGIPPATVARDLLADVGETPGQIDLPGNLQAWIRRAGPAHEALTALLALYPKRAWRVQPDGSIWIGEETWPDGPAVTVLDERPAAGSYLLSLAPDLQPGMTIPGIGRIGRVVHRIGQQLRTEVWTDGR